MKDGKKKKKKLSYGVDDAVVRDAEEEPAPPSEKSPAEAEEELFQSHLKIDPLQIQRGYIEIPAQLAYWNERFAEALRAHLYAKSRVKKVRAQQEPIVRDGLIEAAGTSNRGPTVDQMTRGLDLDARVLAAIRAESDAEVEKARAYGRIDAIRAKKEMLISLGATIRSELEGDPSLRYSPDQ